MGRKLLLLNLLMVAAIVLLAQQLIASWHDFQEEPRLFQAPIRDSAEWDLRDEERNAPLGEFMIITERNLFSENRGNEPLETEVAEVEQAPEFQNLPQLVSVSAIRGEKQAVLTIFSGRRGRDSENRTVRLGDDVEGYEVAEIGRDHLILRWKDVEEIIEMTREASASGPRTAATRAAVKIITVGAAVAAVETSEAEGTEETERGLQVGTVGNLQQGQGPGRGAAGQLNQGNRTGVGGRNSLGGRNGRGNRNQNTRGLPGNVGVGRRPPVQQSPPPN